ncbi:Fur family transcriptional regulator [Oceanobacillus halotolerans]|uniref:Fur family transcriptional regulator n=1 Tax=Oceanobacillus halotolerans TaxID=2663380 RepID=UPI0013D93FC0|nr:Fur family transcriptional regulator [Oceanobacillus halotolerans]
MNRDEAIDLLKQKGYKATGKRKDILWFFEEADGYRTAKDLTRFMENNYEGISYDTIYRNLHLYHDVGILEATELNGEKHFRMNCTKHHHHHFICKDCGKTKEIAVCPMDDVINALSNYTIEDHKFEVYGLCPACKTA